MAEEKTRSREENDFEEDGSVDETISEALDRMQRKHPDASRPEVIRKMMEEQCLRELNKIKAIEERQDQSESAKEEKIKQREKQFQKKYSPQEAKTMKEWMAQMKKWFANFCSFIG